MKKLFLSIITLLVFSGPALSHRDMTLTLNKDGSISNIPVKFGAARLEVIFNGSEKTNSVSSVLLTLGKKKVSIPKCVTQLLRSRSEKDDITIHGSWYHNESILPYYLGIVFSDRVNISANNNRNNYSLLFNLHNAKLIKLEHNVYSQNGKSLEIKAVNLSSICKANDLVNFMDSPIASTRQGHN